MRCHSDPFAVILSEAKDLALAFLRAVCPTQSEIPRSARNDISWFLGFRRLTNISDCSGIGVFTPSTSTPKSSAERN